MFQKEYGPLSGFLCFRIIWKIPHFWCSCSALALFLFGVFVCFVLVGTSVCYTNSYLKARNSVVAENHNACSSVSY